MTESVSFNPRSLVEAGVIVLDGSRATETAERLDAACMSDGVLRPMPAAFYAGVDRNDLSVWCVLRGLYCLPTLELVDFLREQIAGETAIEIGAGHGCIGRALGIPITDSKQQERPDVAAAYRAMGTAPIVYPLDVEKLTALQAVEKYRPSVVIGAWVTWRYKPDRHASGGNVNGIDEGKLIAKPSVQRYVMVGHERVHAKRPMLGRRQTVHRLPLFSRALDNLDVVWVWS